MITAGILGIVLIFVWLLMRKSKKLGKIEAEAKQSEEVLKNVEEAKSARSSSDELERVRKKYTRK